MIIIFSTIKENMKISFVKLFSRKRNLSKI